MISALTNHLWQSTLFAMVAALLTLVLRKNRAAVRYSLWFAASCKFLIPFSLLISLGSYAGMTPIAKRVTPPAVSFTMLRITQPAPNLPSRLATGSTVNFVPVVLFGAWVCGFLAIMAMRYRGWRGIESAVRTSTSIDLSTAVDIRNSPGLLEPGVVGLFRPILLLPEGIVERLSPPQFKAVLAHELCHVRRRDNFMSAIHMTVEAIFWFHPLVWWIGARLIDERERACDEEVLLQGSAPHDYAEGILTVCKSYVVSPLSCVAGVTGSNLKKRVEAILAEDAPYSLNFARKLTLVVAASVSLVTPIVLGMMNAPVISAQAPTVAASKFMSASITPCEAFRHGPRDNLSPGRFNSGCTTVQRLVQQAFGLFATGHMDPGSSVSVTGGPAWTTSDLYQIDAQAEGSPSRSAMNGPTLQALLEDRFGLKIHRETREVLVYALTLAGGGPKLQPFQGICTPRDFDKPASDEDCGAANALRNGLHMKDATTADLCAGFSVLLGRPVRDNTGLAGRFDMRLDLSAEDPELLNLPRSLPALSNPTTPAPPPVLFAAAQMAMKKLGLNLEPVNAPGDFIVIDSVARPSQN